MSNIIVEKSSGDLLEVTLSTLFNALVDSCRPIDVLRKLNHEGRIRVELQDGPAMIWRAVAQPASRALVQAALPLAEFTADARLHFALPARIHCRASSPSEAAYLIEETIKGFHGVAPGFNIEVAPEDVKAMLTNLEIGAMSGIENVTINRIDQQRLITRSSLT